MILVASGSSSEPATKAMVRAVHEAVGRDAEILVHEAAALEPGATRNAVDDDAVALGRTLGASAVVELLWKDVEHRRATLHVRIQSSPRWADRDIGFDALDVEAERGRMLGFALASMMPEEIRSPAPPLPVPAPPLPPPPPPEERPVPPPGEPIRWHGAVDAACNGSLGGDATGLGGSISGSWDFAPTLSLRVGAAARVGQVEAAGATSLIVYGAIGLAWRVVPATTRRSLGVGVRLDLLGIRDEVSRPSTDGGTTHSSLLLPGADLALEASWLFARTGKSALSIFASAGGEAAFGATPVFVHGERVATIPPARGVGELGARVHF